MIEFKSKHWFSHVLEFHKSDTLRLLRFEIFIVAVYAAVWVYLEKYVLDASTDKMLYSFGSVHTILGFAFSLLLVFRLNSAYDRWYEGRKVWGALVNDSRNLATKTIVLFKDAGVRDIYRRNISNFVFSMKEHLRKGVKYDELDLTSEELEKVQKSNHPPRAITQVMYDKLYSEKENGNLDMGDYLILDEHLKKLMDHMGACERIKNTPIPYSYGLFLKKFILIYVSTAPFEFIRMFGWWAIPISVIIFYVFVSLELISEEIEDPFQHDPNDLPLDNLSHMIKANVDDAVNK